jgi:RHS repeat-associated protein
MLIERQTIRWSRYSYGFDAFRFSFNGKEKDDEAKGSNNSLDFGARIYDNRLGRFLSVDPISVKFPSLSSYQFAGNSPIRYIDVFGKGSGDAIYSNMNGKGNVVVYLVDPGKTFSEPLLNNNDTWDVIAVTNLADAEKILNEVYNTNNKIQNLVIRTHGDSNGGIHLTSTDKGKDPILTWMDSEDFDKPKTTFQAEQIEAFKGLFKNINEGGTILLTACGLGKGDVPEKLLSIANSASGTSNLKILSNTELSYATFDLDLSSEDQFVFNEKLSSLPSWKQTTMLTEGKFINVPIVNFTPVVYENKKGISWTSKKTLEENNGK